ncbi:MAG: hypothetical protein IJB49_09635 [Clostridia bacterium]|nr:hypothetical protein [Clostridia bacterium]
MKKVFVFIISACLLATLTACVGGEGGNSSDAESVSSEISAESSQVQESSQSTEESLEASELESSAVADDSEAESSESSDNESSESGDNESSESSDAEAEAFDIAALIGTWKRVATEVEGETGDGGRCTLTISGTSKDDLKISYNDKDFPNTKFSNKPVNIVDSATDSELAEGEWYAVVDYVGAYDTTYEFELSEDGKLALCNSFEIDGAPAVSFEIFEKTE